MVILTEVAKRMKQLDSVVSVYYHDEDSIHKYLVVTKELDPDLDLELSDVFREVYNEKQVRFEFNSIPADYFTDDLVPNGAIDIVRG